MSGDNVVETLEIYSWLKEWNVQPIAIRNDQIEQLLNLYHSQPKKSTIDINLFQKYVLEGLDYQPIFELVTEMYLKVNDVNNLTTLISLFKEKNINVESMKKFQEELSLSVINKKCEQTLIPETLEWITAYTQNYSENIKIDCIPNKTIMENLECVKMYGKIIVYRGMSFDVENYKRYENLINTQKSDHVDIKVDVPFSTSTNIDIAEYFSYGRVKGILLEFEVDKKDILVNLNLLDKNKSVLEYEKIVKESVFPRDECEVILMPGRYHPKIISHNKEQSDNFLLICKTLEQHIDEKMSILNAKICSNRNKSIVVFITEYVNVDISTDNTSIIVYINLDTITKCFKEKQNISISFTLKLGLLTYDIYLKYENMPNTDFYNLKIPFQIIELKNIKEVLDCILNNKDILFGDYKDIVKFSNI